MANYSCPEEVRDETAADSSHLKLDLLQLCSGEVLEEQRRAHPLLRSMTACQSVTIRTKQIYSKKQHRMDDRAILDSNE